VSNPPTSIKALAVGDVIIVTFGRDKKTRTFTVVEVDDSEYSFSAYTTSGRVRPGHRSGGALQVWHRDGRTSFSPTLMQQSQHVVSVERLGASN